MFYWQGFLKIPHTYKSMYLEFHWGYLDLYSTN